MRAAMVAAACLVFPLGAMADITVDGLTYKINKTTGIARCMGRAEAATKAYNLVIPSTIPYNHDNYKVTIINASAFEDDYYIRKVTLSDYTETIGASAFANSTVTQVVSFGNNLQAIGASAFAGSNVATVATLPATVTTIGAYAFENTPLTGITFASGSKLTTIGTEAFWGCTKLTSISFPGSLQSIGANCFNNCSALTTVVFGSGSGKTAIGDKCFNNLKQLTSVTFGSPGVGSIGMDAFINCGLTTVTLPSSCTSVGTSAFSSNRLTSLTLNEGLVSIAAYAFSNQINVGTGLTELVIPSTVTSIGTQAFEEIGYRLATITSLRTTPPAAADEAFMGYNQLYSRLYVPAASVSAYQTATEWRDFRYIYAIGSAIEDVTADDPNSTKPVKLYDLQGHEIDPDAAAPGVYIRRQGTDVTKVHIH